MEKCEEFDVKSAMCRSQFANYHGIGVINGRNVIWELKSSYFFRSIGGGLLSLVNVIVDTKKYV